MHKGTHKGHAMQ